MIQFNLLPDVKLEYIRAQRMRRLVLASAIFITAAALALLLILLATSAVQRKHINDLSNDITSKSKQLQRDSSIARVLTVQNQLGSLTTLHDGKPAASRTFTFLNQITPSKASINKLDVDYAAYTVSVSGGADALSTVNQFTDALKFTTYKTGDSDASTKAFSDVVLKSFGRTSEAANGPAASFEITFNYDPAIFDNKEKVSLSVPSITTARSTDLFQNGSPAAKGTN